MARQIGHIFITGTIHDVTYYKMDGVYYARMKSSLSRKKVLESSSFALTRMHANQLADASRIASQLYRNIPKEERNMQLFRAIVGKAKVLLAEGKQRELVFEILMNDLFAQKKKVQIKCVKKRKQDERVYVNNKGRLIKPTSRFPFPKLKPLSFDSSIINSLKSSFPLFVAQGIPLTFLKLQNKKFCTVLNGVT